jgi:hypothetical protein
MTELTSVKVKLTPRNVSRLRNGHIVQLKAGQFGEGVYAHTHVIQVSGVYAKKLTTAQRKSTGVKVKLSPQEIEASGLNIRKAFQTVGKVYKKNIKPFVAPVLKKSVSNAIKTALPAAALAMGQPELVPAATLVAQAVADPATNALGRVTGAYGLKPHGGKYKPPYLSPALPMSDHSMSGAMRTAIRGGSFKTA